MKLLRPKLRVNPRDSLGQGLDAVITLVLFLGAGFLADRWLGTTPLMMIVLTVVGSVGVYYKIKGGYEAKMAEHETERLARKAERTAAAERASAAGSDPAPTSTTTSTSTSTTTSAESTGTTEP